MKALWNRVRQGLGRITRRSVVLFILGALLFLLPTTIAVRWAIKESSPKATFSFSVTVFDQNHRQIAAATATEEAATDDNMADVLYRIISESEAVDRPPFPPEDGTPIYVSSLHNGIASEYTFYFSVSGEGNYYIKNGHYYSIPPEAALAFVSFPEAESLYRIAEPPSLLTNTDTAILPLRASWFYKLNNNIFQQAKNIQLSEDATCSYPFSGAIELNFTNEPDSCYVSVIELNTGRLAFEGSREELATLTVEPDTPVQIHLRAVWTEREASMCYGELSYSFIAQLKDRATFSLSQDTLCPSDFLILTCQSIRSIQELHLNAPEAMTHYLFTNGKTVYCVIPYPSAIEGDTLAFTITHGASTQSFSIPLLDAPPSGTQTVDAPTDEVLLAASPSAQAALDALLKSSWKPLSQTVYFRGNILSLEDYGFTKGYSFGDTVYLADQSLIRAYGTEYLAENGTAVPALMSGEVVATGYSEALGNYTVLHHGLGIQTWYAHLSNLNVRTGDIVATGQTVGTSGLGGISTASGALILCTVNGHLCDPASLQK